MHTFVENAQNIGLTCRRLLNQHFKIVLLLAFIVTGCLALAGWNIRKQALQRLDQTRSQLARENRVPFERNLLDPLQTTAITYFQSTGTIRAVAPFAGDLYAATDAGLLKLAPTGQLLRHFTVLDGLPESDLTCLFVFQSRLWMGTQSQGLVTFDGKRFEHWRWLDRQAQTVTAFCEDAGTLLIGTRAGGLIQFAGNTFQEIKGGPAKVRLTGISSLGKFGACLFVGTFAEGLWMYQNDHWQQVTVAQGLPSNRVIGVLVQNGHLLVVTDFGVGVTEFRELAEIPLDSTGMVFRTIATLPPLSALAVWAGTCFLVRDNGELFRLAEPKTGWTAEPLSDLGWNPGPGFSGAGLAPSDNALFVFGEGGIWQTQKGPEAGSRLTLTPFYVPPRQAFPTRNVISAVGLDSAQNLWVGTFRTGLDVVAPDGRPLTHLESEMVREINTITLNAKTGEVLVATSAGVVVFDKQFHSRVITVSEGLLHNATAQVLPLDGEFPGSPKQGSGGIMAATSRGLSFGSPGAMNGMTNIQGLPGNSVTAMLPYKGTWMVGTMGGLAEIAAGRVVRTFTTANSKLTNNWISGLAGMGDRLFVGTYGGGVLELLPSGEWHAFTTEIGKATVNPNCMMAHRKHLFVGTLNGLWVMDLETRQWTRLTRELPGAIVLSLAADQRYLWVGTTSGIARIELAYFDQRVG
ncbi:MAG: hypothetical protein K1Y36_20080 [Blastocatellia bacterium]|nr:hypothetical protein [Blastocatellia bacterium]